MPVSPLEMGRPRPASCCGAQAPALCLADGAQPFLVVPGRLRALSGFPTGGMWLRDGEERRRNQDTGEPEATATLPGPKAELTAIGVRRPRDVRQGAGLAGEGRVVVHEAAAAREAILRVTASNLWAGQWLIRARLAPAAHPAHLCPALTRPACRPPSGMTGPAKPEASAPWLGSSPCTSVAVPTAWLRSTWMASSRWSSILFCWGEMTRSEGPGPLGPCASLCHG